MYVLDNNNMFYCMLLVFNVTMTLMSIKTYTQTLFIGFQFI
jgi:hypothetical protein